jgi:biotin carboxyl carrier protein
MVQKKFHLKIRNRVYELTLEGKGTPYRLSIKESSRPTVAVIQAEALVQADRIVLTTSGRRFVCAVARDEAGVWVSCQGQAADFEIERQGPDEIALQTENTLRAPMTGRLISVRAQPGQTVQEGDVIAILEAMKMEFRIEAPYATRIEEVHCREGDLVDLGQVLITLASQEDL